MKKLVLITMLLFIAAVTQAQNVVPAKADTFTLKIKYLYAADLSQAAEDYVGELAADSTYCIPSPSITGYQPDRLEVKGTMPAENIIDTVRYTINTYTVTTKSNPEAGGSTDGGGTFDYNSEITVKAIANEGYTFTNWTREGTVVSDQLEYTFHVIEDCVLTANFAEVIPNSYTISVSADPAAGGTVTGGGTFEENQQCTVVATASEGYDFVKWTEGGNEASTQASFTFTVTADRTLVAHFEAQPIPTYTVTISPLITHGTVSVSPVGEVEAGTTMTLTVTPDEGYELESLMAFNKDDVSQVVEIVNNAFDMPAFNVMVSATFELAGTPPVIESDIATPNPICVGDVLDVTAPTVIDAEIQTWQMSADDSFDVIVAYEGQPLNASYNGWKLRFMATNALGTVYSNVVTITVKDMSNLTLSGDLSICTALTATYTVDHAADATLTWEVTDENAIVEELDNTITVVWATKGTQQVSVLAEDPETGCSIALSMDVNVQSYINQSDVRDIVAKKYEGKPYLLIYPNPKDSYKYQWYKDGKAITGANGQYYSPTEGLEDGAYQVYISFNADANGNLFCGAFSNVFTVGSGSVDFAIYPNPAEMGESLIVVNDGDEAELFVYTIDGKLVHRQTVSNGQNAVDVVLPQGIYVLRLNDGENVKIKRIVVQ